jgi:hypothetical protein
MNNIKANILPFDTCLSLSVDFMSETTRGREDIPRQCEFNSILNYLFYTCRFTQTVAHSLFLSPNIPIHRVRHLYYLETVAKHERNGLINCFTFSCIRYDNKKTNKYETISGRGLSLWYIY